MFELVLDHLPGGADEGVIQAWFFEEGDSVMKGEEVVELSTEEGTVTLTAPVTGILAEVYYDEGETVSAGEILCLIEDEEDVDEEDLKDEEEKE